MSLFFTFFPQEIIIFFLTLQSIVLLGFEGCAVFGSFLTNLCSSHRSCSEDIYFIVVKALRPYLQLFSHIKVLIPNLILKNILFPNSFAEGIEDNKDKSTRVNLS